MPLVTRQANQGVFFKTDTEPPDWQNSDIWIDTDNSNLAINRNGTSVQQLLGTYAQGDILHASLTDTLTRLAKGTADQVLTMNSGATLPEWATLGPSLWSVLGDYEAAIAEATHTFTFTAVDFDDDSELVLVIDGSATAAFSLLARINADSTNNYLVDGFRVASGVETLIDLNAQTSMDILNSALIAGANFTFWGTAKFGLMKGATSDFPICYSHMMGAFQAGLESKASRLGVDDTSITDITILTSTSTWKIGTRMTLYKVARA